MKNKIVNKKYVFVGDIDSINIEIIAKSFLFLKNKVNYVLIGSYEEIKKYLLKINSPIKIQKINDIFTFDNLNQNKLNIYDILYKSDKLKTLINQIEVCNFLALKTGIDLVTMPINKSIFKENIDFIGMTEHLGKLNNKQTYMLMYGDKFSVVPLTTHINVKNVFKKINNKFFLKNTTRNLLKILNNKNNKYLGFKKIFFLCYNPHCGENNYLGLEDYKIKNTIKDTKIKGPIPADSAFNNLDKNILFLSSYHDQALIPFKILNKKAVNITLGLKFKRLSPAHGTAKNIKYKNMADITSYLQCMLI